MKKIVRVTENDIENIVKTVISEQGMLQQSCTDRVDIRENVNPVSQDIEVTKNTLDLKLKDKQINLFSQPRTRLNKFLIGSTIITELNIPNKDALVFPVTINETKYTLTYSIKEKIEKGKFDYLIISPAISFQTQTLNKVYVDELTSWLNCFFKKGFKSDTQKVGKTDFSNYKK